MEILHKELAYEIVGCAYEVYNKLGYGFLEKVYENAFVVALKEAGLEFKTQFPIKIHFHDVCVGEYYTDIIVEDKVIIELKSVKTIAPEHKAQLLNYLTATGIRLGLLINFGPKELEYKRIIK